MSMMTYIFIESCQISVLADPREWPRGHARFNSPIKSNLGPALWGQSNMNAFTIFIQISSLVDRHERTVYYTTIQLYVSITSLWMIKYVQYLIITSIITSHLKSFYRHSKLSATRDEVGTGGLQSFKANISKTELTYHVVVCISGR